MGRGGNRRHAAHVRVIANAGPESILAGTCVVRLEGEPGVIFCFPPSDNHSRFIEKVVEPLDKLGLTDRTNGRGAEVDLFVNGRKAKGVRLNFDNSTVRELLRKTNSGTSPEEAFTDAMENRHGKSIDEALQADQAFPQIRGLTSLTRDDAQRAVGAFFRQRSTAMVLS